MRRWISPPPPLPEAMAMIRSMPLIFCGPPCWGVGWPPIFRLGGGGAAPAPELCTGVALAGPCAVITILTEVIPAIAFSAATAVASIGASARASSGVAASMTNRTSPPSTLSALIRSRETRVPPSGRPSPANTCLTCSSISAMIFSKSHLPRQTRHFLAKSKRASHKTFPKRFESHAVDAGAAMHPTRDPKGKSSQNNNVNVTASHAIAA